MIPSTHHRRLFSRSAIRGLVASATLFAAGHQVRADFTDVTVAAGVSFLHGTLPGPAPSSPLYYAGGLAVTDLDGDGWLDLYATRLTGGNKMFMNNRDGTFRDEAAIRGLLGPTNSNGVVFADLDNDGDADLLLTAIDAPRYFAFINQGDGTFLEEAESREIATPDPQQRHAGMSVTVGDYDRDGFIDIHFNDHFLNTVDINPATHSVLLRNRGLVRPGHFQNTTLPAGVALADLNARRQFAFASYFADFDSDGWPDLAISSDLNTSKLFWNNGDGTFTNGTALAGVNQDQNGMGGSIGDYDNDGDLDWYVTSIHDNPALEFAEGKTGNRLYRYDGNRSFSEVSGALKVRDGGWAWGTQFFDYDNDGDLDLVATNRIPGDLPVTRDPEQTRFWENEGDGSFAPESASSVGIKDTGAGTGLVTFDYDNDGDLDLFIVNNLGEPVLYRNNDHSGHAWLRLRLEGTISNRDGIGARLEVIAPGASSSRMFEHNPSNLFLASGEPYVHLGLGPTTTPVPSIKITWPSGVEQTLQDVPLNQVLTVVEPGDRPQSAPFFSSVPAAQRVLQGSAVELVALASGSPAPVYNWFKDGVRIDGATSSSLRLAHAHPFDSGHYTVSASNPLGTVISTTIPVEIDWDFSGKSVARIWIDANLDAIRVDLPRPTIHSRNLFHLSVALWDAWVAYDSTDQSRPVLHDERASANHANVADRAEAMSHAAYRVLYHRYQNSSGAARSTFSFDRIMQELGYNPANTTIAGNSAAAVGNRIGAAIIAHGLTDGANEANAYADTSGYNPVNDPLLIGESGTTLHDPNRWQPLRFLNLVTQNGIPLGESTQSFVGVNWGNVTPFALARSSPAELYHDPGPPPRLGTPTAAQYRAEALQVLRYSSFLDPTQSVDVDLSPRVHGNHPLGTNAGTGHPASTEASSSVKLADYGRVLAEFWADGPDSETPPGHWNTLANYVSDHPAASHRLYGQGPSLDRLEWDVKLYLALNGAVHDAAIAAWGAKARYDYVRPVSMIRHLSALGQSSDPNQPAYHPEGITLEPGLVEVITPALTANGQKFSHLAGFENEIAVFAWRGEPTDPAQTSGGVGWIRGVDWLPYQRASFVTPPFAAYVSGHSTFSRAAAEVLALFTGSANFPGNKGEFLAAKNEFLVFETSPANDVLLQWRTYYDAADEAGISRLFGGIHVESDDLRGRIMGSRIGVGAFLQARKYFLAPERAGNPITNLSTRGHTGTGENTLILGLVIDGHAPKPVLVRGAGPALRGFGVDQASADPSIVVFESGSNQALGANDNWGNALDLSRLQQVTTDVGAFAFVSGSRDAALVADLPSGVYTFQVQGAAGIALAEIYDAANHEAGQMVNLSTRGSVGSAEDALIAGFVISGTSPVQILMRAIGPGLAEFGVVTPATAPTLQLVHQSSAGNEELARNQGWMTHPSASAIEGISQQIGAFPLAHSSADSALLLTLQPGVYSAVMSQSSELGSGIGLLEIYWVR